MSETELEIFGALFNGLLAAGGAGTRAATRRFIVDGIADGVITDPAAVEFLMGWVRDEATVEEAVA